ncbi:MAG: substrate-binding domain-containing protein [Proteobacteria bacterium]|nr:substrate-binding domain-containing protein [Pseudomonadota bacterium]MBI3497390.1 substrate-binding domain-containing protein [Pseudomonadota bacterium]
MSGRWLAAMLALLMALSALGTGNARQAVRLAGVAGALERAKDRVAEAAPEAPAAIIEASGPEEAIQAFCAGLGAQTADGLVLLRRLRIDERDRCLANGVGELAELDLGAMGFIVLGAPTATLTRRQLWRALAAELVEGSDLAQNRAATWTEIDPSLPAQAIRIIGPEPGSQGARLLAALVLEEACQAVPDLARRLAQEPKLRPRLCGTLRSDAAYGATAPEAAAATRLLDISRIGGLGPEAALIEGVRPDAETIATGKYPLARHAWLTLKRAHAAAIPGLSSLIAAAR